MEQNMLLIFVTTLTQYVYMMMTWTNSFSLLFHDEKQKESAIKEFEKKLQKRTLQGTCKAELNKIFKHSL